MAKAAKATPDRSVPGTIIESVYYAGSTEAVVWYLDHDGMRHAKLFQADHARRSEKTFYGYFKVGVDTVWYMQRHQNGDSEPLQWKVPPPRKEKNLVTEIEVTEATYDAEEDLWLLCLAGGTQLTVHTDAMVSISPIATYGLFLVTYKEETQ